MLRFRSAVLAVLLVIPVLAGLPARAQTDAAELLLRLDRLEGENRRLNGQVEQMGHHIRRLEDQLKRFQSDVDFRFKEGGGKPMPAPAANPAVPAVPAAPPAARKSDAFDPAANPAAPGAPRTMGQLAAEAANPPPQVRQIPGALPAPGAAPQPLQPGGGAVAQPPVAALPTAGTPKGDFDIASAMLDRGELDAAEGAFRDFVKKYPRDRLKPDALFNLGESFYRRNRYREAAEQYLVITTEHGQSGRAAEAMLKLGMSLRGLGATAEACGTYAEVGKKYPKASAAVKQAVEREKKRAQCAA